MCHRQAVNWCIVLATLAGLLRAADRKPIIERPRFDPAASRVELFDALAQGLIAARMIPHDESRGAVFIENLSGKALTVELPEAFVGVQVLPQVGVQFPAPNGPGSGPGNAANQSANGNQPVGGRATGNGASMTGSAPGLPVGPPGGGPGFFSVPPERTVRIEYGSVCLQHGAPTPNSGNVYRLVRVEDFSSDPLLPRLLGRVGDSTSNQSELQAAAWHLVNGLPWEELAALRYHRVNAPDEPQFSAADLSAAQRLLRELGHPETHSLAGPAPRR